MAKFCTKCGKPTVDGKCPDCDTTVSEVKEEKKVVEVKSYTNTTNSVSSNQMMENIKDLFKNVAKKPVDITRKYIDDANKRFGNVLCLISAVMYGIYGYIFLNFGVNKIIDQFNQKIQQAITSAVGNVGNAVGGLLGGSSGASMGDALGDVAGAASEMVIPHISVSFVSTFLSCFVIAVVAYAVLAIMGKLFIGVVGKTRTTIGELMHINSVTSVVSTALMAVATVLAFIFPKLSIVVALAASIAYFVVLVQHYKDVLGTDEGKLSYTVPLMIISSIVVVMVVAVIVMSVVVASSMSSPSSMYY